MRWLATIVPLGFVACSYPEFGFSEPSAVDASVEETSNPPDSRAAVDSDEPAVDSIVADTAMAPDTRDAETADTTDTADTADTRDAADTAVPTGCVVAHAFCSNFDMSTAPSTGWSGSFGTGAATLALTTTTFVSPSKSIVGTTTASTATASAMVSRDFVAASSGAVTRIEASIMLSALTYGGPNDLIVLKLQRSSVGDGVAITVGPDGVHLAVSGTTFDRYPITGLTAGKWFRVRIDAVLHTTTGSVKLWVDDMTAPKITRTGVSTAEVDDAARQLVAGVFSWMGSSPFTLHLDDVSID